MPCLNPNHKLSKFSNAETLSDDARTFLRRDRFRAKRADLRTCVLTIQSTQFSNVDSAG